MQPNVILMKHWRPDLSHWNQQWVMANDPLLCWPCNSQYEL